MKRLRLIKGKLVEEDFATSEINSFETLLKTYLLKNEKKGKIIDISCFYNIECDDLIGLVNRIGG